MALHLQKLCVGCDGIEDLRSWITEQLAARRREGRPIEHAHTTRMVPRRVDELLDGGSLYWVIKGVVQVRQRLLDIRSVTADDGIARCQLVLEPDVIAVEPQPRRPFQGWRYLAAADAPADLHTADAVGLPPHIVSELRVLGLW
jgi:hypothetical protein